MNGIVIMEEIMVVFWCNVLLEYICKKHGKVISAVEQLVCSGKVSLSSSTEIQWFVVKRFTSSQKVKELEEELKSKESLTELNLRNLIFYLGGNNVGPEGAKVIAIALKNNTSLTKLYLDLNNIGAEGAKEIAMALIGNNSLTELNFGTIGNNECRW